jgi:hypothetical protein
MRAGKWEDAEAAVLAGFLTRDSKGVLAKRLPSSGMWASVHGGIKRGF